MENKILKTEEMITKLLTDCVAAKRLEDGMHEILNAYGGDSIKYTAASKSQTLSVAMDLAIDAHNSARGVMSDLIEYFYSDKVDWSNYREADEIATDILIGWNYFLKKYPKAI